MNVEINNNDLYKYALRLGDSTLILAQRFCEEVGKSPTLEEEIAQSNIGLDTLGQANAWLELAAKWQGLDKTADDLAYWRTERDYTNYLMCELENGDFARIIMRAYLFTSFTRLLYRELQKSNVEEIVAVAIKSSKELDYHHQHLSDWVERLGLGTEESHKRMQNALDYLWPYNQEFFDIDELEENVVKAGIAPDKNEIKKQWLDQVVTFLKDCNLTTPDCKYFYDGGTKGQHTEVLGFLLSEMQTVTRQHPNGVW